MVSGAITAASLAATAWVPRSFAAPTPLANVSTAKHPTSRTVGSTADAAPTSEVALTIDTSTQAAGPNATAPITTAAAAAPITTTAAAAAAATAAAAAAAAAAATTLAAAALTAASAPEECRAHADGQR